MAIHEVVVQKKERKGYYLGLKTFLLRYYTEERAVLEIEKVENESTTRWGLWIKIF